MKIDVPSQCKRIVHRLFWAGALQIVLRVKVVKSIKMVKFVDSLPHKIRKRKKHINLEKKLVVLHMISMLPVVYRENHSLGD